MKGFKLANSCFAVKVVKIGERYGLDNVLTHGLKGRTQARDDFAHKMGPLVEFYDLRWTAKFGPEGQFVARYFLKTLLDDGARLRAFGLDMDGGVPSWKLSGAEVAEALAFAAGVVAGA